MLMNFESQNLTPLVAIDLSAAFDTVNHNLLLQVLNQCYGVCDSALKWVTSYLEDRSFQVVINGSNASPVNINFSVPRGSLFYCATIAYHVELNADLGRPQALANVQEK